MVGTIQAFRVSLWITTRGRDSLWTTSGCRSITKVCVLCCVCLARVCLNYTLSVESARKSSPCGVNWFGKREKVRPARENWLDFGVFGRVGRVFRGLAKIGLLLGKLFCAGTVGGARWANFFARERLDGLAGRTFSRSGVIRPPARAPRGANRQQLADDGLLFRHADDAGALAQGQGRGHGHGAGAAREHEENQHVFGAHGQDWGDAGGQADGREC